MIRSAGFLYAINIFFKYTNSFTILLKSNILKSLELTVL